MSGCKRGSLSKHWMFTSFHHDEEPFLHHRSQISYLIYKRKTYPEDGHQQLEGYVAFKNRQRLSAIKKMDDRSHFTRMHGTPQEASDYYKKDGDFIEFGTHPPARVENFGFAEAVVLARAGNFRAMLAKCPGLYVRYKRHFESLRHFPAEELDQPCGVWITGPPCYGKNYAVRHLDKPVFNKPLNKWWDGYKGEDYVLLSGVAPHHAVWMGDLLKNWIDRYPFIAEMKGSSVTIRPKRVFVTSHFKMSDVFSGPILVAIAARCDQMEFVDGSDSPVIHRCPQFPVPERVLLPLKKLLDAKTDSSQVVPTSVSEEEVSSQVVSTSVSEEEEDIRISQGTLPAAGS